MQERDRLRSVRVRVGADAPDEDWRIGYESVNFHRTRDATQWRGCQREIAPFYGVPAGRKRKGDDQMLSRLGVNIERERKACGLTQEKLAEMVDLHPRVVQKIEAGETNIKATTLFRIQAALGCDWESLVPPVR